jgi:flagellar biosynthesis protein FlhB
MVKKLLLSRFGWSLLTASIIILFIVSYFIPNILSLAGLNMKESWPTATKMIVQLTIGSWCASTLSSVARVYVWLRALFAEIPSTEYHEIRDEVKMIQNLFLWILGLMTTLSGYVTLWFSGGQ